MNQAMGGDGEPKADEPKNEEPKQDADNSLGHGPNAAPDDAANMGADGDAAADKMGDDAENDAQIAPGAEETDTYTPPNFTRENGPYVGGVEPWHRGNPDHINVLMRGVEVWNQWRQDNPEITPDLRGADFTDELFANTALKNAGGEIDLSHANFSLADCEGADFSGARCGDAKFSGADCTGANFNGAICVEADFRFARCEDVDFSGANCRVADFSEADCTGAIFCEADCTGANFCEAYCGGANFSGAHCGDAKFSGADCTGVNFSEADCTGANFSGTKLEIANFEQCDVSHVTYDRRGLRGNCHGVMVSGACGHAVFIRDVQDQDYIDQLAHNTRLERPKPDDESFNWRRPSWRGLRAWWQSDRVKWEDGALRKPFVVIGGLIMALVAQLVLSPQGPGLLADMSFTEGLARTMGVLMTLALIGAASGPFGRRFIFWLWGLFDYGRDWDRVVIFSALMVFVFGALYAGLGQDHFEYLQAAQCTNEGAASCVALNPLSDVWFYPWFIAVMGFLHPWGE